MGGTPQSPLTPEAPSGSQRPSPGVRQQYQPPEGAISIARLKRVGLAFGLLVLGYFTTWGSCHRQPIPEKKKPTAQAWPMSPANIDSQQAESNARWRKQSVQQNRPRLPSGARKTHLRGMVRIRPRSIRSPNYASNCAWKISPRSQCGIRFNDRFRSPGRPRGNQS